MCIYIMHHALCQYNIMIGYCSTLFILYSTTAVIDVTLVILQKTHQLTGSATGCPPMTQSLPTQYQLLSCYIIEYADEIGI